MALILRGTTAKGGEETFEYGEKLAPETEDSASHPSTIRLGCHGSIGVGSVAFVLTTLAASFFVFRKRKD